MLAKPTLEPQCQGSALLPDIWKDLGYFYDQNLQHIQKRAGTAGYSTPLCEQFCKSCETRRAH